MIENLFESFHMQYQAGSARQQLNPLIIFVWTKKLTLYINIAAFSGDVKHFVQKIKAG